MKRAMDLLRSVLWIFASSANICLKSVNFRSKLLACYALTPSHYFFDNNTTGKSVENDRKGNCFRLILSRGFRKGPYVSIKRQRNVWSKETLHGDISKRASTSSDGHAQMISQGVLQTLWRPHRTRH